MEKTARFLYCIPTGAITYAELNKLDFFESEGSKKKAELKILKAYPNWDIDEKRKNEAFTELDNITEFIHIVDKMPDLKGVLDLYNLQNCLSDCKFQSLETLVNTFTSKEAKNELSSQEASKHLAWVTSIIQISTENFEIFEVVADSHEFSDFLQRIEDQGEGRFSDLYDLITHYLQHEEYDEEVLNQLPTARKHMLPFLRGDCTFVELMENIHALGLPQNEKFSALRTINRNVVLVEQWFSKAEVYI